MDKIFIVKSGQQPTEEQRERIREAAKREIVYDKDCPELSPAMLKSLHCAVSQRNRSLEAMKENK